MHKLARLLLFFVPVVCLSSRGWAQPMVVATAPAPPGDHFFISMGGGFAPPPMIIPPLLMGMKAGHLTADQQKQVDRILQSNGSQTAPLFHQLQSVHEQIADKLLGPGTVNASDLAPLEDKAAQLDAQIQHQALAASVKIRSILTPDQVARMAQFHRKMSALQEEMRSLMMETSQQPASGHIQ